jgi:hypothetical protein
LLYIPYLSETPALHRYNIKNGRDVRLAGDASLLHIANDEWSVAPNGQQLVLRSARDGALWLIRLVDGTF